MDLHNRIIEDTLAALPMEKMKSWEYGKGRTAVNLPESEFLLKRDTAWELGGSRLPSVSYTCVTSEHRLVGSSRTMLLGPDLGEIRQDVPFARLAFIETEVLGDGDEAYRAIKDIEMIRYQIFPKGYMIRATAMDCREQVRVGRKALAAGVGFEQIGNLFIRKYLEHPLVKNVLLVFITGQSRIFPELEENAVMTQKITRALSSVLERMETDCQSCNLKEICDQVEDLRKIHFNKTEKQEQQKG